MINGVTLSILDRNLLVLIQNLNIVKDLLMHTRNPNMGIQDLLMGNQNPLMDSQNPLFHILIPNTQEDHKPDTAALIIRKNQLFHHSSHRKAHSPP